MASNHNLNPYIDDPWSAPKTVDVVLAKKEGGLDTFVYSCHHCVKKHRHSSGYMFVVMLNSNWLYFCNVECHENWLKCFPEVQVQSSEPVTDRRVVIAATKAKHEENHPGS